MIDRHVVLYDPSDHFWEGALIDPANASQVEAKGVATLPVMTESIGLNGAGGYAKRAWGSGWPLKAHPSATAKVVLFVRPGIERFHWKVRIRHQQGPGGDLHGQIRFCPDASQLLTTASGLSAGGEQGAGFDLRKLEGMEESNAAWHVGGTFGMRVADYGYVGFAVFGHGAGFSIEWAAVSQTD